MGPLRLFRLPWLMGSMRDKKETLGLLISHFLSLSLLFSSILSAAYGETKLLYIYTLNGYIFKAGEGR